MTGSGTQMMLGHNSLGFTAGNCSMRVLQNGNLRLNVPTGGNYTFRINDVEQYNNTQIKNLVDNISVTQEVDLDTMESNIASNNAKVSTQWSNNGSEVYINQNVGIGTTAPTSTLHTGGSFAANIRNDAGATVSLANNDYTVIISNMTANPTLVDLPTANATNLGRIYILKNATATEINNFGYISSNVSTGLASGAVLQIQSDGNDWYQIN